jgi:hypothetical protein
MRVLAVRDDGDGQLVLQVSGGREVQLGDMSNLSLKLAVAAAILPKVEDASYVDVSVLSRAGRLPERRHGQIGPIRTVKSRVRVETRTAGRQEFPIDSEIRVPTLAGASPNERITLQ